MNKRRFFLVVWNQGFDAAMYIDADPRNSVAEWLKIVAAALNAQAGPGDAKVEAMTAGTEAILYDWSLSELPADILVGQVPKPGLVFAVRRGTRLERDGDAATAGDAAPDGGSDYAFVYALKREVWRGDGKASVRANKFLDSPEAEYEPDPITRYDAFVSYGSDDLALVTELSQLLQARGVRTFLASRDLAAAKVWTDEIRVALAASRVALIVLTPTSVGRPWVMCEVGAGWALGKPIVPALLAVDPTTLPEVITSYQCFRIETINEREMLADAVRAACASSQAVPIHAASQPDAGDPPADS